MFENRQGKITYFLNIQDPHGIDASVKANIDSLWLFGGFSSQKFNHLFQQISVPMDSVTLFQKYQQLSMRQAILIHYTSSGTQMKLIDS